MIKINYNDFFNQNVKRRLLINKLIQIIVFLCVLISIIPLGSILIEIFKNGISAITLEFLLSSPGSVGSNNGGIGPAIQGTLLIILFSSVIGIPIGIFSGIFISEFNHHAIAKLLRFFNDVFMEFPSIILGIFAFLTIVLLLGYFSILAGAFALSLIMVPIISRTTEESLKMVPITYREAGLALGLKKSVITIYIIMTAAKKGIINGIILSVCRISGETAPLIMTTLGSNQFFNGFDSPTDALTLRIWRLSLLPYDNSQLQGWGAVLVLIIIIIILSLGIRYIFENNIMTSLKKQHIRI